MLHKNGFVGCYTRVKCQIDCGEFGYEMDRLGTHWANCAGSATD